MKKFLAAALVLASCGAAAAQGGAIAGQTPQGAGAAGRGQRPARAQPARADAPRGTAGAPRPDHHRRQRHADPPRAGARVVARGARVPRRRHRCAGPLRDQGSARRPLHHDREQGRLRRPAIRAASSVGIRNADRARRRADARQAVDRAAARQRAGRPHHRRVRRAGRECQRQRVALRLRRRHAPPDAGRPERARHHRRSGPVPVVRPAARRVLRQRDAARQRSGSHRSDGRAVRIRIDLFPRHQQRQRGGARHAGGRAGEHRREFRLDRHAAGPRVGPGADVGRCAGDQRHGDAVARECRRTARRRDAAGRQRQPHRPDRSLPHHRTWRRDATRCRHAPAAASSSWRAWTWWSAPTTSMA